MLRKSHWETVKRLRTSRRKFGKITPKRACQALAILLLWLLWSLFYPEIVTEGGLPDSGGAIVEYGGAGAGGNAPSVPGRVRVCSWNVRNYSVAGRHVAGRYVQAPKPEIEKAELRKGLLSINADVVLIQEMGDMEFLKELRADLAREKLFYPYIAVTRYDSPSRLAIMSRIKPVGFVDCCDIKFKFRGDNRMSPRGTLGARFKTSGVEWCAFTVHLKSAHGARKSDENFTPFRFAELRAIASRIAGETAGCGNILIAGDFNQEPSSALVRNLEKLRVGIVRQSDSRGNGDTYYWNRKNKFFKYDYFLISEQAMRFVSEFAKVWGTWGNASDHRPVFVDLNFSSPE